MQTSIPLIIRDTYYYKYKDSNNDTQLLSQIKFEISYCERGAIPLAFPKWSPATTTGIPWFPAATEAVCLYIIDTSEWIISEKIIKIGESKFRGAIS